MFSKTKITLRLLMSYCIIYMCVHVCMCVCADLDHCPGVC